MSCLSFFFLGFRFTSVRSVSVFVIFMAFSALHSVSKLSTRNIVCLFEICYVWWLTQTAASGVDFYFLCCWTPNQPGILLVMQGPLYSMSAASSVTADYEHAPDSKKILFSASSASMIMCLKQSRHRHGIAKESESGG